jgi:outer membrane receptor protein involved in Fe transport
MTRVSGRAADRRLGPGTLRQLGVLVALALVGPAAALAQSEAIEPERDSGAEASTETRSDARAEAQSEAAEGRDDDRLAVRETVVVTASRIEQAFDELPVSVVVLDEGELRRSAALTVDDTLRRVPGFSLFRRSSSLVSHPTTQGVSLRGIGPSGVSRTLVLLDGIPLNDPFGGWVYWSRVPRDGLSRVEIVRGGSSSVWGNYALGGVIQLLTRQPDEDFVHLLAEGGERQTWSGELSAGRRFGAADLSLAASTLTTDGYPVVAAEQRGPIDVPAFSEVGTLAAEGRFATGPSTALRLRLDAFDEERGNGTPLTGNDTRAATLAAHLARTTAAATWSAALFVQDQEFASTFSGQADDRSSEQLALDQFLVDSAGAGLSAQWTRVLDGGASSHTLTAGADLRFIDGETNEDFRNLGAGFTRRRRAGGEQTLGGLFVQDSASPASRWHLQLGLRADVWQSEEGRRLETSLEDGGVTLDEIFPDRDETELSPKLAILYELGPHLALQGSAYRSFRAPTINELFRPFRVRNDITEANAALEPESLLGAELGLVHRGSRGSLVRVTGFWNRLDDPVSNVTLALGPGVIAPCGFVPDGGSCRQRQNLDEVRVRGLEAEASWRSPSSPWAASLSYLLSDPEVRSAPAQPELEGKRVAQVPEHQLVGRLERIGRSTTAALQARWVGEQSEDDLNERLLDDFVSLDLYLARRIGASLELFAAVENLFDETIEAGLSGDGLLTVGAPRMVHGGVRLRLPGS